MRLRENSRVERLPDRQQVQKQLLIFCLAGCFLHDRRRTAFDAMLRFGHGADRKGVELAAHAFPEQQADRDQDQRGRGHVVDPGRLADGFELVDQDPVLGEELRGLRQHVDPGRQRLQDVIVGGAEKHQQQCHHHHHADECAAGKVFAG